MTRDSNLKNHAGEKVRSMADKINQYTCVAIRDGDGYTSYCPELRGCMSQGDTVDKAMDNLTDAITVMIESLLEDDLPVPEPNNSGVIAIDFENLWDWD